MSFLAQMDLSELRLVFKIYHCLNGPFKSQRQSLQGVVVRLKSPTAFKAKSNECASTIGACSLKPNAALRNLAAFQ